MFAHLGVQLADDAQLLVPDENPGAFSGVERWIAGGFVTSAEDVKAVEKRIHHAFQVIEIHQGSVGSLPG